MARGFLVVGMFADSRFRVGLAENLPELIEKWTRTYGEFLPVVAHRTTPDAIRTVIGTSVRLSNTLTLNEAAVLFGQLPVDKSAVGVVSEHTRKLGPLFGALLSEWQTAVGLTTAAAA